MQRQYEDGGTQELLAVTAEPPDSQLATILKEFAGDNEVSVPGEGEAAGGP